MKYELMTDEELKVIANEKRKVGPRKKEIATARAIHAQKVLYDRCHTVRSNEIGLPIHHRENSADDNYTYNYNGNSLNKLY